MNDYELYNLIYELKKSNDYDGLYAITQQYPPETIKLLRYLHKRHYEDASRRLWEWYGNKPNMHRTRLKCLIYASRYGSNDAKIELIRNYKPDISSSSYKQLVQDVNNGFAWYNWVYYQGCSYSNPPLINSELFNILQLSASMGYAGAYIMIGFSYAVAGDVSNAITHLKLCPSTYIEPLHIHNIQTLTRAEKLQIYRVVADMGNPHFIVALLKSEFTTDNIRRYAQYIQKDMLGVALSTFVPNLDTISILKRDPIVIRAMLQWHVVRNNVNSIRDYQKWHPEEWPLVTLWSIEVPLRFYPIVVRHAIYTFLFCAKHWGISKDVSKYICTFILTENGWIRPKSYVNRITSLLGWK